MPILLRAVFGQQKSGEIDLMWGCNAEGHEGCAWYNGDVFTCEMCDDEALWTMFPKGAHFTFPFSTDTLLGDIFRRPL